MLNSFSSTYWQFVYLLWRNVCLFKSFAHFLIGLSLCCLLLEGLYRLLILNLYHICMICEYFLTLCKLSFLFLDSVFRCIKVFFNFDEGRINLFFFILLFMLWCLRFHCQVQGHKDLPLYFSLRVLSL